MKVYVGAKFENKDEVKATYAKLRAAGHEITCDWTPHSAEGLANVPLVDKLQREAIEDLKGVLDAQAMIFLHNPNCQGGFIELGAALGAGKLVLVVGGRPVGTRFPIFYLHPRVHLFDTVEAAINFLTWVEGTFARPSEATYNGRR